MSPLHTGVELASSSMLGHLSVSLWQWASPCLVSFEEKGSQNELKNKERILKGTVTHNNWLQQTVALEYVSKL